MGVRVVLVDGSALIYRAFFAIPPHLTTKGGLHTNAVFGFATMFKKLFNGKRPALGAVVFDAPGRTFRDEKYPEYKAQRSAMPAELREQLPVIDTVVTANGFPMVRMPGWEADDVIGTLTLQARQLGHEVVIVSCDKDFAQLLGDGVRMHDTLKDVVYDRDLVYKKWGVWPEQMCDYLALMGDSSDNIPGVAGIGQKGAQLLLKEHGSLDALLQKLDTAPEGLKPRIQTALSGAGKDSALLSKMLATIDQHVPLPMGIGDLVITDSDPAALNALFTELEFYSLLTKDQGQRARADATAPGGAVVVCDSADDVRAQLAALCASPTPVALFAIVDGGSHLRGSLTGLACAADEHSGCYVPCGAHDGDDDRLQALVPWLQDATRPKAVHDHKALTVLLSRRGITLRGVVFDPQLASFLINPTKILPHGLDAVCREYLHRTLPVRKDISGSGKTERPAKDGSVDADGPSRNPILPGPAQEGRDLGWGDSTSGAPRVEGGAAPTRIRAHRDVAMDSEGLRALAGFGVECAQAVWALTPLLQVEITQRHQQAYLNDVDFPLAQVLASMEQTGIAVDVKELAIIGDELRTRLAASTLSIHAHAGRAFHIGSPKQLGTVLFDELKLPIIKRTKTGYSTDADVLERLAAKHEICRAILEYRKIDKLIHTYVDVLSVEALANIDQRVRCTFHQTTAATGRLITTEPDLQRTLVKSDEGVRIRKAFVANTDALGPQRVLIDADWSQIELRLLAHVSGDPLLVEAYATQQDIHKKTAGQIFNKDTSEINQKERDIGKTINFATIYGQGAQALSQQLHIERKQAQRYIDQYFESYQGVAAYIDWAVEVAHEKGYAETLLGRRRIIPELKSNSPMDRGFGERVAVNTPIQGSAADVCKVAMIRITRRLAVEAPRARLLLQIHDELVFDAPIEDADAVSAIAKTEMERCVIGDVKLRVPLVAAVGVGRSWGDAKAAAG